MTDPSLSSIGAYRVVRRIGQGGFASVFECIDDRLEAKVAVKLLAENYAFNTEVRSRFLSEGRLLRQVDSRHVIQVYDVGTTNSGQPYLVLELADRGDLRTRVFELHETGWQPSLADVFHVLGVLRRAVGALHEQGLVHRDLTPGNLLLRSTGAPVNQQLVGPPPIVGRSERMLVADLGLAKDVANESGFTVAAGTPGFAAPEQLEQGRVTKKVDVYASAKIVEWLLARVTGSPAWKITALNQLQPALSPNPDDRPDSVEVLESSLTDVLGPSAPRQASASPSIREGALDPTLIHSPPPTPPAPTASPTSTPPSSLTWLGGRKKLVSGVLAIVAVVAIVGTSLFLMRDATPELKTVSDNLGEVSKTVDAEQLVVTGPETIPVGRIGRFVAAAPKGSTFVWETPDGRTVTGTNVIKLQGAEPGSLTVGLTITLPSGATEKLNYPVEIVEAG